MSSKAYRTVKIKDNVIKDDRFTNMYSALFHQKPTHKEGTSFAKGVVNITGARKK
jgi:hypothetical protein